MDSLQQRPFPQVVIGMRKPERFYRRLTLTWDRRLRISARKWHISDLMHQQYGVVLTARKEGSVHSGPTGPRTQAPMRMFLGPLGGVPDRSQSDRVRPTAAYGVFTAGWAFLLRTLSCRQIEDPCGRRSHCRKMTTTQPSPSPPLAFLSKTLINRPCPDSGLQRTFPSPRSFLQPARPSHGWLHPYCERDSMYFACGGAMTYRKLRVLRCLTGRGLFRRQMVPFGGFWSS